MRKLLALLIVQLSFMSSAYSYTVSGYIFEDYNFGGVKRSFNPSFGMTAMNRIDIQVRLTNLWGWQYNGRTGSDGYFSIYGVPNGTYTLSLPNLRSNDTDNDLYSERGNCNDCMPVQIWPEITEDFTRTVVVNNGNVTNADMGFNYSSVINNNNSGGGSLRQFLVNTQKLTSGRNSPLPLTKSNLRQIGHPLGYDNAIFAKPIASITINSPLEFISSNRTIVDANVLRGSGKPVTINNHRTNALNSDYGIKVTGSYSFKLKGFNWNNFDDAVYINGGHGNTIENNSFNHTRDSGIIIYTSHDNIISNNYFHDTVNKEEHNEQAAGLFVRDSDRTQILGNVFVDTGDDHRSAGGFSWNASGVRILYGNENLISQNTFNNTKGTAIDLRSVEAIGDINPNDNNYNWAASVSNYSIDSPVIQSINNQGEVVGKVRLDNLNSSFSKCNFSYETINVEVYLAQGSVSDSTIEGTNYLGSCSLNNVGNINSCALDVSLLQTNRKVSAITIDRCGNTSEMAHSVLISNNRNDYGDAPNEDLGTGWGVTTFPVMSSDNGASHGIDSDVCLTALGGAYCNFSNDKDDDGQPTRDALGDFSGPKGDASSIDYDDGVKVNPSMENLSGKKIIQTNYLSGNVETSVTNILNVNTSSAGYVSAWLDINQDGRWESFSGPNGSVSEQLNLVNDGYVSSKGSHDLEFSIPSYAVHGESWLRVRFASHSVTSPSGSVSDGEVEDYQVWIAAPSLETGSCSAGLQNPSFEYRTNLNNLEFEYKVPGWSTIPNNPNESSESKRNQIEVYPHTTYGVAPSPDNPSNSFVAELNAHVAGMLYQDIVTVPGDKIRWSFDYVARPNSGAQQVSLMMGNPESFMGGSDLGELVVIAPNATSSWKTYSQSYTVPQGQYVTRFGFKANKPASGSLGNLIDNVVFGCEDGLDFGDLPSEYTHDTNVSRIVDPRLYIGPTVADTETAHQASDSAKGDDADGFNDELTFSMPTTVVKGSKVKITGIPIMNSSGSSVELVGLLDVLTGSSYKFTGNERSDTVTIPHSNQTQYVDLTWTFSNGHLNQWTTEPQTYLRLILGSEQSGIGEIEDHLVTITDSPLVPKPGRCDGFVQTKKDKGNSKKFEYLKWVPEDGEVTLSSISNPLAISRINSIGVNQVDGYTYGLGLIDSTGDQYIVFADQTPNVQFYPLHKIVASEDLELRVKGNLVYQFSKGEPLNSNKTAVGTNDKLSSSTAGDVSPDGTKMVLGKGAWQSLVIVDLATGEFSTVHVSGNTMGADLAFHPAGNGEVIYTLSGNLQTLYKTSTLDGTYEQYSLKLLVGDGSNANPKWPESKGDSKLTPGGFGISQGGTLFVMTNGGIHDLNQDGSLDSVERNNPTTALYTIELNQVVDGNKRPIRFIQQGEAKSLQANDAGGCVIHADYGDVPVALETDPFSSFSPAKHIGSNESLKLGALWSADLGPGDDSAAASDPSDDGVTFKDTNDNVIDVNTALFIPGRAYSIELDEKGSGVSRVWVSFDGAKWNLISNGTILIPDTGIEKGYLRVRYASNAADIMSPYGEASDGEVEDYALNIGNALEGMTVAAPTNPLTCEVAQYTVTLAADGDELSQDVNVQVSFDNAPDQCWFDAASFTRTDLSGRASCKTDTRDILFEAGGNLSRIIYVATDFENTAIKLVAEEADIGKASDATTFSKEGFRITTTPVSSGSGDPRGNYYIAGRDFDLKVERKVALSNTNCTVDPDYEGSQTFKFSYDQGAEAYKGALSLGSVAITSDTPVDLKFTSGVSDSVKANYRESGHLNISAKYTPIGGTEKQAGLANALHVKPYALVINDVHQADDASKLDDGNSSTYFVPAETVFTAEVLAVALGHTNSAPRVTKNFNASLLGSDGYTAVVETPVAKNGNSANDLKKQTGTTQFDKGIYNGTYWYQNVGAVAMNWAVDSYGVGGLSSFLNTDDSVNNGGRNNIIGHFYPDAFKVTSNEFSTGVTKATDSSQEWTYFGQPNVDLNVSLEAVGVSRNSLSFYDFGYWTTTPFATLDDLVLLSSNVCADRRFANGIALFDGTSAVCDFGSAWSGGELNISLSGSRFVRNNAESTRLELNDVKASLINQEFDYVVGDIADLIEEEFEFGEPIDVRYGRLAMQSAAGPIEQLLPMRIQTEYWNGNGFEVNDWHSQSSSDLGTLSAIADLVPQPKEVGGGVPVISPEPLPLSDLVLGQMGTSIQGSLAGSVDVPFIFDSTSGIQNWLGYCWRVDGNVTDCAVTDSNNYIQPPSAIATFGATTSSDNIIYIMERFE